MPCPFPGMDPYLEDPEEWPDVHNRLIVHLANSLGQQLRPKYRVAIAKRTYQADIEDFLIVSTKPTTYQTLSTATLTATYEPVSVTMPMPATIKEGYLEIRKVKTGEVITAIEILSPSNKHAGKGRKSYIDKRRQVLGSENAFGRDRFAEGWKANASCRRDSADRLSDCD